MKRTLIVVMIAVGMAWCMMPSPASAQAWDDGHELKIILPSGGDDPTHTVTLVAPELSQSDTLTLPSSNADGVLMNDGSGALTWGPTSVDNGGTGQASPLTTNGLIYGASPTAMGSLSTANNGVLITNGSGVPSISSTLPAAVQGNITSTGTLTSGTWHGTTISADHGGTGAASLAAHGVVLGNGTSAVHVTSTGSTGEVLMSNGSSADPTFQSAVITTVAGFIISATGTTNNTFYYNPYGGSGGNNTAEGLTTSGTTSMIVPHIGTIRNFYVIMSAAPGSGNSNDWYVHNRTTGTDGPHIHLTGTSATTGSDLSGTLSVSAGDEIEIKRVSASGPTTTGAQWSFEIDYP